MLIALRHGDIIAETKVGAWRRPTLLKIIKKVFSVA